MRRYFGKALGAQLRAGRALWLLSALGVALGVGTALSVQILNQSALGAFTGSVRAVSGEAQLAILGRTPYVPEQILPRVLAEPGVSVAWPLYRLDVALSGPDRLLLEIAGMDLTAPVRVPWQGGRADLVEALGSPGWVALTPALAKERGWKIGDRFEVSSGSRRAELRIGALVDFQRLSPLASHRLAIMDIAQTQGLLGSPGRLSQIDVVATPGANLAELRRRLEARLGPSVRVATPEQRAQEAQGLLAAFRLNLTALSLISLFVGGFLIYASTRASLVRRREEFGILRSLGATRGQLLALILGETALLAMVGTALGLPLGYLAARHEVGAVSGTLQNLYLLEGIEQLRLPPRFYALAPAMGLAGAWGGALLPALEVARRSPRDLLASYTLEEAAGAAAGRLLALGVFILATVMACYLAFGRGYGPAGFAVALAILFAVPLSAAWLVRTVAPRVHAARLSVAYGLRTLAARLQTTAVAVAALSVAVSMMVGVTVMIGSFRRTVEVWLDGTLRADVYVTTPSWRRGAGEATLGPDLVERLRREPGVRAVDRLRQLSAYTGDRGISLSGFDAGLVEASSRVQLLGGDPREALRRVREEGAALVSEPLARKERLWVGDRLRLQGARGEVAIPIAGVYYDYGAESGAALVSLATLEASFGKGPVTNVALHLDAGADPQAVVDRLRTSLSGEALVIRSNRRLRRDVLGVFDQTFAVTRLLQTASLLIAVCGIALTLLVLARERAAELALYRALGASRGQLFRVFLGRGLGMGLFGLALGTAGGLGLALVLVHLVNRDYFGWTLAFHLPWRALAEEAFAILAAALVASLYPAARASRTPATELSRDAL